MISDESRPDIEAPALADFLEGDQGEEGMQFAQGTNPIQPHPQGFTRLQILKGLLGLGVVGLASAAGAKAEHDISGVEALGAAKKKLTANLIAETSRADQMTILSEAQYTSAAHSQYVDMQGIWGSQIHQDYLYLGARFLDPRVMSSDNRLPLSDLLRVREATIDNINGGKTTIKYISRIDTFKAFLAFFNGEAKKAGLQENDIGIYYLAFCATAQFKLHDFEFGTSPAVSAIIGADLIELVQESLLAISYSAKTEEEKRVVESARALAEGKVRSNIGIKKLMKDAGINPDVSIQELFEQCLRIVGE